MTNNYLEKLNFTPYTGYELKDLKDERLRVGGWVIDENDMNHRIEVLNRYDQINVQLTNVMLISSICNN